MKYRSNAQYTHGSIAGTGILLTNLGTPDAPTTSAVRRYLAEFLSDPRVIEVPKAIWLLVLHGFILRTRPQRSAKAYRKVWLRNGDSPLRQHLLDQANLVQTMVEHEDYGPVWVEPGMRYGKPSIAEALRKLADKGIGRLLVLPLYPQYSATTTASTFDAVSKELQSWRWLPEIRMVNSYHDFPPYVDAIAKSISSYQSDAGSADKLLFSFHGLPQHYFMAGDPYHCACHKTARLVAEKLALEDKQWAVSFQSRLGARPWLKPYTDVVLQQWAESGIGRVQVVCPGFSADCLETLEEVQIQYYELFRQHGGQDLQYIPALNSSQEHLDMMISLIRAHCAGWRQTEASQLAKSRERAISMGADQ